MVQCNTVLNNLSICRFFMQQCNDANTPVITSNTFGQYLPEGTASTTSLERRLQSPDLMQKRSTLESITLIEKDIRTSVQYTALLQRNECRMKYSCSMHGESPILSNECYPPHPGKSNEHFHRLRLQAISTRFYNVIFTPPKRLGLTPFTHPHRACGTRFNRTER